MSYSLVGQRWFRSSGPPRIAEAPTAPRQVPLVSGALGGLPGVAGLKLSVAWVPNAQPAIQPPVARRAAVVISGVIGAERIVALAPLSAIWAQPSPPATPQAGRPGYLDCIPATSSGWSSYPPGLAVTSWQPTGESLPPLPSPPTHLSASAKLVGAAACKVLWRRK